MKLLFFILVQLLAFVHAYKFEKLTCNNTNTTFGNIRSCGVEYYKHYLVADFVGLTEFSTKPIYEPVNDTFSVQKFSKNITHGNTRVGMLINSTAYISDKELNISEWDYFFKNY